MSLDTRFAVVADSSDEGRLFLVDRDAAHLVSPGALSKLLLLGYQASPQALGITIVNKQAALAPRGMMGADTKPLPPGARGFRRVDGAWELMDDLAVFEPIRVLAAPCPPTAAEQSFRLGAIGDVDALIPYGPERILVVSRGNRQTPSNATVHVVSPAGIEPALGILHALSSQISGIGRVAGYALGDDAWLVFDGGDVLRLSPQGDLEKVASAAVEARLELVGAAGGVGPDGLPEVFVFSSRARLPMSDRYAPAELYHLAPNGTRWEATGFPAGDRDPGCPREGGVGNVEMTYIGPGKVRFTYERGEIYTYDAATRAFSVETISAPANQYCRAAVDWADPQRPIATLERTVSLVNRAELHQREGGIWRLLGELPPGIEANLSIRFGGELYLPRELGQVQLFRAYQDLQRRNVISSCPPILSSGGNMDHATVNGRLLAADGGRRDGSSYVEVAVLPQ